MLDQSDYLFHVIREIGGMDPLSAIKRLYKATTENPEDPRPLLLMASRFASSRDTDHAEAAYLMALQRSPQFHIARFQLGLLQFSNGRPATAQVTWAPLDLLSERSSLRLFKQAMVCIMENKYDTASDLLREGMLNNPENIPLNYDMELLLHHIEQPEKSPRNGISPSPLQIDPDPSVKFNPNEEPTEGLIGTHFLLSAYKKQE